MEQIRARVDAIVKDPKTAAALKPYYPYGCKRPTFHDEYLPTFNLPHVHLVDTAPLGVSEINERGVVHDGVEYPLDVLIYATGFQWMAHLDLQHGHRPRRPHAAARSGRREGTKTFLGLHSHGFPNLFIVTGPQGGGGSFNFTDAHRRATATTSSGCCRRCANAAPRIVDVTQGTRGGVRRALPRSRHRAPRRCATASPTTTATATPSPAASPITAARRLGTARCKAAQASLEPYVFEGGWPSNSNQAA